MWLSILLSVMIFCNLVSSLKIYYGYTWLFFVLPFGRKQQTAVLLPLKSPCIIDGVTAKTFGYNFITKGKSGCCHALDSHGRHTVMGVYCVSLTPCLLFISDFFSIFLWPVQYFLLWSIMFSWLWLLDRFSYQSVFSTLNLLHIASNCVYGQAVFI